MAGKFQVQAVYHLSEDGHLITIDLPGKKEERNGTGEGKKINIFLFRGIDDMSAVFFFEVNERADFRTADHRSLPGSDGTGTTVKVYAYPEFTQTLCRTLPHQPAGYLLSIQNVAASL